MPVPGRLAAVVVAVAAVFPLSAAAQAPPAAAAAPVTPAAPTDKVVMRYRAQKGQIMRYRSEGTMQVDAMGRQVTMDVKETQKATVVDVAANGDITSETVTEETEMRINGNKMPSSNDPDKSTVVVSPVGQLVSRTTAKKDPEDDKTGVRMFIATQVIFPEKAIGPGDKWVQEYAARPDIGARTAHADFEVLAAEQSGGVECLKVKMVYRETEGKPAITITSTQWLEKSTGDAVAADMELDGLEFGPPGSGAAAKGKLRNTRTEGSPVLQAGVKAASAEKKAKTIDDTVKEYEKLTGLFTIYRKTESGRETIYLEIREDQLGKHFMLEATASTGSSTQVVAGTPISDTVFLLRQVGEDKLMLVAPNTTFRAPDGTPLARSVKRSTAEAYLEQFKIEAKQPERKSLLINISDFFRGDFAQISSLFSSPSISGGLAALTGGGSSYSMDREKTSIRSFRVLPENLVVETDYNFTGSSRGAASSGTPVLADPRSIPVRVVFTLLQLPESGYRPRLADPRVGYFTTDYLNLSRDDQSDQTSRYILRWRLDKENPKAATSLPKKPIVFWLDNAIPTEYRPAVREGLLMWNKAFEKIGIKDAVVVKQMPDDADWDHADMRYNTIRWVTSQSDAYAVALFRPNPITGEILNASITVDGNMIRATKLEKKALVDPAAWLQESAEGADQCHDARNCRFAQYAAKQAWLGFTAAQLALRVGVAPSEKAYVAAFLRSTVCHEMGHILGLRHNFAGSTAYSLEQLKNAAFVKRNGVTSSVMDYTPFNVSALKQRGVDYFSSAVGKYDQWAVKYGYMPVAQPTTDSEAPVLRSVAAHGSEPGLAFQSDEIADQSDPMVVRFDLGSDPLAYSSRSLSLARYLMLNLNKRLPEKGQPYWTYTRGMMQALGSYSQSASIASRFIGGIRQNRSHRGDPGERPAVSPVPAADQRKALALLTQYVFDQGALSLPKAFLAKMGTDPYPDMVAAITGGGSSELNVRDMLASLRTGILRRLLGAAVLRRIANNEFRAATPADAFTMAELFQKLGGSVWSELSTGKPSDPMRRQLQRAHVDALVSMVVSPATGLPDDARTLAWDQLRSLKLRLATAQRKPSADTYTRTHVSETLAKVNRALDARLTISGPAPATPSLMQMLMGGSQPSAQTP
jgi:hypothetical protein